MRNSLLQMEFQSDHDAAGGLTACAYPVLQSLAIHTFDSPAFNTT